MNVPGVNEEDRSKAWHASEDGSGSRSQRGGGLFDLSKDIGEENDLSTDARADKLAESSGDASLVAVAG